MLLAVACVYPVLSRMGGIDGGINFQKAGFIGWMLGVSGK